MTPSAQEVTVAKKDELGPLQETLARLQESARPANAPPGAMIN